MRLAVAASGALGFKCIQSLSKGSGLVCLLTDSNSAEIVQWCMGNNIPFFKGNPRTEKARSFIKSYEVDILFSINYIFLFDSQLISWPLQYAFNIHGSLLPKYRGRTPHVWAIINGESKTGLTVHLIDEGCDTGDIVLQKEIHISPEMTGGDVLRIFSEMYPGVINEVLKKAGENSIHPIPQDNTKATYFGKRTPEDGAINWDWPKEKIYNWVRAQARPYPGAFGFCNGEKIIIHKIRFYQANSGEDVNGKVLHVINGKPVVKSGNGPVILEEFESSSNTEIKEGDCFDTGYQDR